MPTCDLPAPLLSLPTDDVGSAVAAVVKQAVERIGRIREAALKHLRTLVSDPQVRPFIPAVTVLDSSLPTQVIVRRVL